MNTNINMKVRFVENFFIKPYNLRHQILRVIHVFVCNHNIVNELDDYLVRPVRNSLNSDMMFLINSKFIDIKYEY